MNTRRIERDQQWVSPWKYDDEPGASVARTTIPYEKARRSPQRELPGQIAVAGEDRRRRGKALKLVFAQNRSSAVNAWKR